MFVRIVYAFNGLCTSSYSSSSFVSFRRQIGVELQVLELKGVSSLTNEGIQGVCRKGGGCVVVVVELVVVINVVSQTIIAEKYGHRTVVRTNRN